MSRGASGGALAAFLIIGAILGFAGGAYLGSQSGADANETNSATTPVGQVPGAVPPSDGSQPSDAASEPAGDGAVALTAGKTSVGAGERIDLTGSVNPAEEGVQLQVQRSLDGGDWQDFPVSPMTTKADGTFSTWVQTSQAGDNSFRVVRVDDPSVASEPVVVTIG
jgi:hypothetical protein